MPQCAKEKQLIITTSDKVGMLLEVTSALAGAGINITALCAYSMEGKAIFMIVASDADKAQSVVEGKGWNVEACDVVVADVPDKVGAVKDVADKIKAQNINIEYIYGSVCSCTVECASRLVIKAADNDAVIAALK